MKELFHTISPPLVKEEGNKNRTGNDLHGMLALPRDLIIQLLRDKDKKHKRSGCPEYQSSLSILPSCTVW